MILRIGNWSYLRCWKDSMPRFNDYSNCWSNSRCVFSNSWSRSTNMISGFRQIEPYNWASNIWYLNQTLCLIYGVGIFIGLIKVLVTGATIKVFLFLAHGSMLMFIFCILVGEDGSTWFSNLLIGDAMYDS